MSSRDRSAPSSAAPPAAPAAWSRARSALRFSAPATTWSSRSLRMSSLATSRSVAARRSTCENFRRPVEISCQSRPTTSDSALGRWSSSVARPSFFSSKASSLNAATSFRNPSAHASTRASSSTGPRPVAVWTPQRRLMTPQATSSPASTKYPSCSIVRSWLNADACASLESSVAAASRWSASRQPSARAASSSPFLPICHTTSTAAFGSSSADSASPATTKRVRGASSDLSAWRSKIVSPAGSATATSGGRGIASSGGATSRAVFAKSSAHSSSTFPAT
mmetsp:Transcript_27793/g.83330  ORF Transcript_27793/g.83330 Transcript_27793/m.83330 type:complete len:280 (-) Transcript_27793:1006-1845(-)